MRFSTPFSKAVTPTYHCRRLHHDIKPNLTPQQCLHGVLLGTAGYPNPCNEKHEFPTLTHTEARRSPAGRIKLPSRPSLRASSTGPYPWLDSYPLASLRRTTAIRGATAIHVS